MNHFASFKASYNHFAANIFVFRFIDPITLAIVPYSTFLHNTQRKTTFIIWDHTANHTWRNRMLAHTCVRHACSHVFGRNSIDFHSHFLSLGWSRISNNKASFKALQVRMKTNSSILSFMIKFLFPLLFFHF